MLPSVQLARATVTVGGVPVEVVSLSRAQAVRLISEFIRDDGERDTAAAEVFVIACGTGQPEAEVKAWREATDSPTVSDLLDAIMDVSGLKGGTDPQPSGNAGS